MVLMTIESHSLGEDALDRARTDEAVLSWGHGQLGASWEPLGVSLCQRTGGAGAGGDYYLISPQSLDLEGQLPQWRLLSTYNILLEISKGNNGSLLRHR